MKYLAYSLSIVIILLISACNKENLQGKTSLKAVPKIKASLPGTWKVIGSMISSGGPLYFVPADGKDHASFNTDGALDGSAFPGYKFYTLKDSVTIKITKADKAIYQDYFYNIHGDTLSMSPAGPVFCIEGCVIKLVKE
ncbi:MAG TPA: hypothetical protein VK668_19530 [Mucilaginibacter sp.]|nr:hypothetical protein [Mucilaginibacter sp.]